MTAFNSPNFSQLVQAAPTVLATVTLKKAYEALLSEVEKSELRDTFVHSMTCLAVRLIKSEDTKAALPQMAVCAFIGDCIKRGEINTYIQDNAGKFWCLEPDTFEGQTNGGQSVFDGQTISQKADDAPSVTITEGLARDWELKARFTDIAGSLVLITASDFERLKHLLLVELHDDGAMAVERSNEFTALVDGYGHTMLGEQSIMRQELRESLKLAKYWTYSQSLLWVAFRDYDVMADELMPALGDNPTGPYLCPAGTVGKYIATGLQDGSIGGAPVVEFDPITALRGKLQQGLVKASGYRHGRYAREEIPPVDWNRLLLNDIPPVAQMAHGLPENKICAFSIDESGQVDISEFWSDVLFWREHVRSQFQVIAPAVADSTKAKQGLSKLIDQSYSDLQNKYEKSKHWDLATTLFWIAFRNTELVAKCRIYWERCTRDKDDPTGLIRFSPAQIKGLNGLPKWCDHHLTSPVDHLKLPTNELLDSNPDATLLDALQNGLITAHGTQHGTTMLREIQPIEWLAYSFCGGINSGLVGGAGVPLGGYHVQPAFVALVFEREKVMGLFRAPTPYPVRTSDEEIDAYIRSLEGDTGIPLATNKCAKAVATKFSDVSHRRAKERRRALYPNQKQGPKGPRSATNNSAK